ncbi:MAG: methyltransferase domain-containing protein [Candidatus Eremiobacteraeota bacterium]|nr:methyltransferase domain-containing protein [Candidatus Eremiobacteraeota bacterium]MBC5823937.1 methyltransferase domain-containing protein [Candidatus Eremiobacteraeota bacterium]
MRLALKRVETRGAQRTPLFSIALIEIFVSSGKAMRRGHGNGVHCLEDVPVLTEFYETRKTDLDFADERMRRVVEAVVRAKPNHVLDIACGRGFLLKQLKGALPESSFVGVDISEGSVQATREGGFEAVRADVEIALPFAAASFDCVVFGEVIEHLVDPDAALVNIATVLRKDGHLVLTTPNLASWFNRIILLAGFQPIFTETSLHVNLGRGSRFLGQWRSTQGHLKIFTLAALQEMLKANGFEIKELRGVPFHTSNIFSLIDRCLSRIPSLASNFVITAINMETCATQYPS